MTQPVKIPWRRRLKRALRIMGSTLVLLAIASYVWKGAPTRRDFDASIAIIDGDSLAVKGDAGPLTIRLSGVDAPEYRQNCQDGQEQDWACGKEARSALVRIAGNHPLQCTFTATDQYDRRIGRCSAPNGEYGTDLAAALVAEGWAIATDDAYLAEQDAAQSAKRGIWRGTFLPPAEWRAAHVRAD